MNSGTATLTVSMNWVIKKRQQAAEIRRKTLDVRPLLLAIGVGYYVCSGRGLTEMSGCLGGACVNCCTAVMWAVSGIVVTLSLKQKWEEDKVHILPPALKSD